MVRRLCALACALLIFVVAPRALAADVGIVARDPSDPFVARLILELSQLSLTAAKTESVESSRDTAVLVVGTDLELVDVQADGSQRKRKLVAGRSDALKVAEEVHALMLPLVARREEPQPPRVAAPPPPPPKETPPPAPPAQPPRRSFESSLSAGAIFGAAKPGLAIGASIGRLPMGDEKAALGIALSGVLAAVGESVSSVQGSAEVRPLLFGPEVVGRYAIAPPLALDLGIGAFAAYVMFRGSASAPFVAQSQDAWTFSPAARARALLLFGGYGIFVEGRVGAALPSIAVRFAGESVHEWGRPWATASGGLAYTF